MTKKIEVLIVDDQKGWYEAISPILEEMGCVINFADTVTSALTALQNKEYRLVLLDLRLREEKEYDFQGLDILEQLSKREKSPPAIIFSGHVTPALRQKAEWYKAFAFLEKSGDAGFDRDKFVSTVKAALGQGET